MSADDRTRIFLADGVPKGTQLNGIYEIDEKIASGGMGEVYRGHNIQTGDLVAIKIVLPDFARDHTILALFRKEASVLNHLAHPAIVRYYVFSIDPGIGRPYLAMEFVDGPSLADRMATGPLPVEDASLLVARIASGLATAHEAGVVHRDLSPDNIILSGGSVAKAKIIDFGIARSETIGGGTLLGGRFAGKYNFVSPEQLGLFGGDVTERSDVYSLGLVFAAALRGAPLDMSGSQLDVIEKRRLVPPLEGVPEAVRPIVQAMLRPDPAERPERMALIAEWLTPAKEASAATQSSSFAGSLYDRTVVTAAAHLLFSETPASDGDTDPFAAPGSSPRRPLPRPHASLGQPPETPARDGAAGLHRGSGPVGSSSTGFSGVGKGDGDAFSVPFSHDGQPGEAPRAFPGSAGHGTHPGRRFKAVLVGSAAILALAAGSAAWLGGLLPGSTGGPGIAAITESPPRTPETTAAGSPGASAAPPSASPDAPQRATPPAVSPPAPSVDAARPSAPRPSAPDDAPAGEAPARTARPAPSDVASARPDRFAGVGSAVEWLRNYDGGACFFARALSVSERSMSIEGFGSAVEPFHRMDAAFRDANGYEPSIGVRKIAEPQCPLPDFMRQTERDGAPLPQLDLSDDQIRSGDTLQGVVRNLSDRSLSLWLIDDQGIVHDLNQHLKRAGDRASFNIRLVDPNTRAPLPQLIFAISSDTPLASLRPSEPKRIAAVLSSLRAEMARDGKRVGVSAKYFELGG